MKRYRLILSALLIAIVIILLLLHSCQPDAPAVSPTGNNDSLSTDTTATSEAVISTSEGPANYVSSESETTTVSEAARESTEPITEETTGPETTESKPTEPKPTEPKPTEPEPTEPKPTEPKPTEPKPTNPPPHTHSWSAWTQTAAPTCTAAGSETRSCSCGTSETRTVSALGHSWGGWTQAQAPTCGADGTETRSCSRCGQTETRTLAATGNHSWTETAPTCTAAGSKTCTVCGKSESIAALGHDWVHHAEEGHWRDVLTCRCGAVFYTYEEWNNHMHSYLDTEEEGNHTGYSGTGEWIVDVSAYDSCSRCGAVK